MPHREYAQSLAHTLRPNLDDVGDKIWRFWTDEILEFKLMS